MRLHLLFVAALSLALVAACTAPQSSPRATPSATPGTGTVTGSTTAGPTCPVERPGDSACAPRVVAGARVIALGPGGRAVATAISDAGGRYLLDLPAGDYTIEPQPVTGLMGTPLSRAVTVRSGATVVVDFSYDTGIR